MIFSKTLALIITVLWEGLLDEPIAVEINVQTLEDLKTTICLVFEQDPDVIDVNKMRIYLKYKRNYQRIVTDDIIQHFNADTFLKIVCK